MKLPITKIKKMLRKDGYSFSIVEISFWEHKNGVCGTCNILNMNPDSDLIDIGELCRADTCQVEDDGLGLAKLDLRLLSSEGNNVGYVDLFVFDGEPYLKLPPPINTEFGRAIYLASQNSTITN
jgi:hypothetical protein